MATQTLVETILSGVLTGGATAASTIYGFFRSTKERLDKLESALGKSEPRSGFFLAIQALNEGLGKIQTHMEDMNLRVKRLEEWGTVGVIRTPMPFDPHAQGDSEARWRDIQRRMGDLEDNVKRLERRVDGWNTDIAKVDERRSQELGRVREEMASVNGLLRGLMAALDYEDRPGPPRPAPRR